MDNDNKVNKLMEQRHQEVLMFLHDELTPLKRKNNSETYNLEKEYAKTKKNKSPFVVLVLLGCIAVVALVSFGLSKSIDKANKEIKVNLEEFDDVNLKNLIDTVARTQDRYEAAVRNKSQLEAEKGAEISAAASKRENELLLIKSLNLSNKKDESNRQRQVNETYENEIKEINAKYEVSLSMASAEVEEYKKKLDEYDQSKLAVAQEQEKALDSQRQLQEIEKRKLIEKYDSRIANLEKVLLDTQKASNENMKESLKTVSSKYQEEIDALDPVIIDSRADEIVEKLKKFSEDSETSDTEKNFANHKFYENGIANNDALNERIQNVKSLYDDFKYIDQKVIDIPHKHTIGDYVKATDRLIDDISISFADVAYLLYDDTVKLENRISDLKKEQAALEEKHKKQIADLNATHTAEIVSTKAENDVFLVGVLESSNTTAIIKNMESKENIVVFVVPALRSQITEDGMIAEIKGKKAIKGKIVPLEKGDYLFVPGKDKKGTDIPFELSDMNVGTAVKLSAK